VSLLMRGEELPFAMREMPAAAAEQRIGTAVVPSSRPTASPSAINPAAARASVIGCSGRGPW
jgi:hypothetical protein